MTEKLYELDSHMQNFSAKVISCEQVKNGYAVVLDKTAFFPEGGGQSADTGTLGDINVLDVKIKNGIISHITDKPLEIGAEINGTLNFEQRFCRMQNHSGEHIVSGLIHAKYGYNNVGFHMGSEDVTLDLDGVLSREQLDEIEYLANKAVTENVNVTANYPEPQKLAELNYRSKLDLTENVRIVTIDGYDMCACCAPHVSKTGEIGIIKLLDFIKYKGGIRIHMLCGFDALKDYNTKYRNVWEISNMLSAKQNEAAAAVSRLNDEISKMKQSMSVMSKELMHFRTADIKPTDGNLCLFAEGMDMNGLREYANEALKSCGGICAVFSGNDNDGYTYVILSKSIPLRDKSKDINSALNGRGGGRDDMLQGSMKASKAEIEKYFTK